ncbi:MAG: helix-turn-helix domain-containing protein [Lachnospiraceae bacterium]|jgi:carbohydrate diacid regulator|nr:helix-turn-helix domain-containing protein [Lachnospiraceae bacterium]
MITNQILLKSISSLQAITKVGMALYDTEGNELASADGPEVTSDAVRNFVISQADSQESGGIYFLKIGEDGDIRYVLACDATKDESYQAGRICVAHLSELMDAYRERDDKGSFYQNLILDNLLLVDIYNRARKLRIEVNVPRCVYLVSVRKDKDSIVKDLLKGLFAPQGGDVITSVDENTLILIKCFKEGADPDMLEEVAQTIVSSLNTEAMLSARVSYGTVVEELKDVSKSYKEARMAMDVGSIFYAEKNVTAYTNLGIGRLIYQLPVSLCEMFLGEIFDGGILDDLDEESRSTIKMFFENNLNVSETSRQLFIHRNTLVYRIEKLQKTTGLDLRSFDDAVTFKIALMVESYLKHMSESMD